jgi:hypothetical protein
LRKLGGGLLQLGCIALGGVRPILGQVDLAEGASAQLFDQFEIFAYDEFWVGGEVPWVFEDMWAERKNNIY